MKQFTCKFDTNSAETVCGVCGTPQCSECINQVHDPSFLTFELSGRTAGLGVGLLVGVPLLLEVFFPRLVIQITSLFYEYSLYLETGLIHSAILVGAALLLGVWYRQGDGLLEPTSIKRSICDDCNRELKGDKRLYSVIVGLAVAIALVGLYVVATDGRHPHGGPFLKEIRIISVGAVIYLLRDELYLVIHELRNR